MTSTIERARGRWRDILPQLGIAAGFLQNRHGPCPLCGGKDRFRFDDRDGSGSYYCNQCGPGPGLMLVRRRHDWSFAEACVAVDRIIGTKTTPAPAAPQPAASADARRAAAITRILADATQPAVVVAYHQRRGLTVSSPVLRGHPRCPYFDGEKLVGRFPAVIAPLTAPDGRIINAQRIYDADLSPRKMTMRAPESIVGAAVRLHEAAEEMGVGEGYETCLAAYELFGVPVWAALTEGGLQSIVLPSIVRRLHIFADNDSNFVGQHAAYALARRVHRERKGEIEITVHLPDAPDTDWLDVLNLRGRQ